MDNGVEKSIHMKQGIRYKMNPSACIDGFETTSGIAYHFIGCETSPGEVQIVNIFENRWSDLIR
ncbi:hypothetical protein B7P43_G17928 [Cryptotermes secundus]|uniref:Uncharacterized protein n=1 Tax=Cryptotermes secundus TaxID=105785 RepID=A0A2J7QVL2_9NEOP|nr:hypothetical protein B7P43_G17928 [Cryptotermes secundus]